MKDKFDIVSGDFEGNFYTHQKTILTNSEFNSDEKKHDIYLYRGELSKVKEEKEYNPEQLRNRDSFLLHNVTNVQFHLDKDAAGSNNNRIYNFEQLLLRDAVIKESWELNGKTYGIITGKLLGKVKDEVKPPDPSNPQEPTKPPPIIPDPLKPHTEPVIPPPTGGSPSSPNSNSGCLNIGNGCLPAVSGCLSNIWNLLLALLLLLFFLWFLKGCWGTHLESKNCCGERDSLALENKKLNIISDSLKNEIIKRENLLKECQNEQKRNQELEERRRRRNGRVGDVTVTLVWDSEDDLDLCVVDPNQEKIWHKQKKSTSGGELDIDVNKHGNPPYSSEPVENIRWIENPPEGNYSVVINYFAKHSDLTEIPFYLEIKTNENIETYEGILKNVGQSINYSFNFTKTPENQ